MRFGILRTDSKFLGFKVKWDAEKQAYIKGMPEGRRKLYDLEIADVENLLQFSIMMGRLEREQCAGVAYGGLTEKSIKASSEGNQVQASTMEKYLEDKPSHLLMLDIDGLPLHDGSSHDDTDRIIKQLGEQFNSVSCLVQYTAGHNLRDYKKQGKPATWRAKLFYWLERPMTCAQQRRYLDSLQFEWLDTQPNAPHTVIYTSKPKFSGVSDPVKERLYLKHGEREFLTLPDSAYAEIEPKYQKQTSTTTSLSENQIKLDYTGADHGIIPLFDKAMAEIEAIPSTPSGDGQRGNALFRASYSLGRYLSAGRLPAYSEDTLIELAMSRASAYRSSEPDYKVRSHIERGIKRGQLNPYYQRDMLVDKPRRKHTRQPRKTEDITQHTSSMEPTSHDEMQRIIRGLIKTAVSRYDDLGNAIQQVTVQAGGGKTTLAVEEASFLNKTMGKTVFFFAPNHKLLGTDNHGMNTIASMVKKHGIEPVIWEGRMRGCATYQDTVERALSGDTDASDMKAHIEDIFTEQPIPAGCATLGCPLSKPDDKGYSQCEAHSRGKRAIDKGQFYLATFGDLPTVSRLIEKDQTENDGEITKSLMIFIDEHIDLPGVTEYEPELLKPFKPHESDEYVRSLINDSTDLTEDYRLTKSDKSGVMTEQLEISFNSLFRVKHQSIISIALKLKNALDRIVKSVNLDSHQYKYGTSIRLTKQRLLNSSPNWIESEAQRALNYIREQKPKVKQASLKARMNNDNHDPFRRIRLKGINLIEHLCSLIVGEDICLTIFKSPTGQAIIKKHSLLTLPDTGLIHLDATPIKSMWTAYAERTNREYLTDLNSDFISQPTEGYWIKHGGAQPNVLIDQDGNLTDEGLDNLERLSLNIEDGLKGVERGSSLLLATSKRMHSIIEDGIKGKGKLAGSNLIKVLRPYKIMQGYTGRDDRGSNEYQSCSSMVLLGAPIPNLNSVKNSQSFLRSREITEDEFKGAIRDYTYASTLQWFGRLRIQRHAGKRIIFIAGVEPPQVKGLKWTKAHTTGRPNSPKRRDLQERAENQLDQGAPISHTIIQNWGATRAMARSIVKFLDHHRGLIVKALNSQGRGRPQELHYDPRFYSPNDVDDAKKVLIATEPISQSNQSVRKKVLITTESTQIAKQSNTFDVAHEPAKSPIYILDVNTFNPSVCNYSVNCSDVTRNPLHVRNESQSAALSRMNWDSIKRVAGSFISKIDVPDMNLMSQEVQPCL